MANGWWEEDGIPTSFAVGDVVLSAPSAQKALALAEALAKEGVIVVPDDEPWHWLEKMAAFELGKAQPPRPSPPGRSVSSCGC